MKLLIKTFVASGTLAILGVSQFASAATSVVPCATGSSTTNVMSCSTGAVANLSILNTANVAIGPVAVAYGTAPLPYNVSITTPSLNATGDLIVGSINVSTGMIIDAASSIYTGTLSTLTATATSTVNGLNISLGIPAVTTASLIPGQPRTIITPAISTLSITAKTLTSTSTAKKVGGGKYLSTAGSSEIEDLVISGSGLSVAPVNANALATTPMNNYLVNMSGLSIITNYQTSIYLNGTDVIGLETSALAIQFNNFAFGGRLLNGTIRIADSAATVPETVTWAMMLVGMAMIGFAARRRQIGSFA